MRWQGYSRGETAYPVPHGGPIVVPASLVTGRHPDPREAPEPWASAAWGRVVMGRWMREAEEAHMESVRALLLAPKGDAHR